MKPDVSGMLRMLFIFLFFPPSLTSPLLSSCAAFKINVALKKKKEEEQGRRGGWGY